MKSTTKEAYALAGVDVQLATRTKQLLKNHVHKTFIHRPEVLSRLGHFGGLFKLTQYDEPILVSSVDGVGTKLKIACLLEKHDTIGIDLVNHCVNDILTSGAKPLFFADYIAMGKLIPERVGSIVRGLAMACQAVSCALISGETAEMPGIYSEGDYDLVGFIVGVVEKNTIIDHKSIKTGDVILGLPSSGLHTNGYSLVRKVFEIGDDPSPLKVHYPELGRTLGEELLEPHRCYYPKLEWLLPSIKGMAHITGGGLIDNLPRVLPQGLAAYLEPGSWNIPPIFSLIQQRGSIEEQEMYHVFNMGIGMTLICSPRHAPEFSRALPEARLIGEVVAGRRGKRRVVIA